MAYLLANNVLMYYNMAQSEDHMTLRFTNVIKQGTISPGKYRTIAIKVNGKSIVSSIAKQTPTVKQILSTINHNGKATKEQRREAEVQHTTTLNNNCAHAWDQFSSLFSTKYNNNQLEFRYNREKKEKNLTIVLTVFGTSQSVTLTIPKNNEPDQEPTTHEESKTIGIENVNDGKNYVINENAYAKYGHIERVVDFSDVEDENQLLSLANTYVNNLQFDDMTMEISAVDLHHLTGSVPSFELLDEVRCISRPHGLNKTFPITEINIPLDNPSGVTYKIGRSGSTTMSQSTAANAVDLFKRINSIPAANKVLDIAKTEMSELLNNRTTGYVNIVQENDISQALVISNAADWTQATKLWKFDVNGLGYSDSTAGQEALNSSYLNASTINADGRFYKIGMTMDGTIVADFIKTGLLEDGLGYNYWNLSTGEFRLSQNTVLADLDRLNGSVTTLEELAAAVENTAETVEEVYTKEIGTSNILKFSDEFKILNDLTKQTWSDDAWITDVKQNAGTIKITDASATTITSSLPAPDLKKAVCLNYTRDYTGGLLRICQRTIELKPDTVYTLACYCCGVGSLHFSVYEGSGNSTLTKATIINHTDWRRYNFVFKAYKYGTNLVSLRNTTSSNIQRLTTEKTQKYDIYKAAVSAKESVDSIDEKKKAYNEAAEDLKEAQSELDLLDNSIVLTQNNTICVGFGNAKIGLLAISGLTLVQGNISSDWTPSESDAFEFVRDLDSQLDARNLMYRLTGGDLEKQGVFLENGKLLLNAEYMVAGYIEDKSHYNKWNLKTGYLRTTNMIASNIRATGTLESAREWMDGNPSYYYKARVDSYGITFSQDIQTNVTKPLNQRGRKNVKRGHVSYYGIAAGGNFTIDATQIFVTPYSGSYTSFRCYSGYVNIVGMHQRKNKKLIQTTLARLCFINGLLVGVGEYSDVYNKLREPAFSWSGSATKRSMGKKHPKIKYMIGHDISRSEFYKFYK